MNKLTEQTRDRECSRRAEDETIVESATLGLESGERRLDDEGTLRSKKRWWEWTSINNTIYRDAFTIDPSQVEEAMDTLSADILAYQIAMLPKIMHNAMIDTLRERNTFERIR